MKRSGHDPVMALHLGGRFDQELDSSERKIWQGTVGGCGEELGWDTSCISNVGCFFFFFSSFPNDDPALSSVVDLWGFYWEVWRLSESLGVGNGNWLGLKEESRGSNWLCAEGSVCRRGYCGASVTALHWGRPPLWGPEEILANVEDCHLEGCLNCFLWRLGYLWREEKKTGYRQVRAEAKSWAWRRSV